MSVIPVRVNATHWVVTLLMSIAMLNPWTSEIAAQDAPDSVLVLEPIEVNVVRTPFLQNAAPLAVSALTGGDVQRGRSGFFMEEVMQGLPGVQVQNRFNPAVGERVTIRGFGARAQFGLRGIRVMVDGIPGTLPDGQSSLDHLDIGSLSRVEVIRGPASALYGNASGGVLSFTTQDPPDSPYNMEAMGVGGSDGLWRGSLTGSGTLGSTGYLVTISGQTWNGFRTIASNPARPRADTLCAEGADSGNSEARTGCYGGADRFGLNARVTTPMAGGEFSVTANLLNLDAESPGSKTDVPDSYREINDLYLRFRTGKDLKQQQLGVRWAGAFAEGLDADISAYGIHRDVHNPIPFDVIDLGRYAWGVRAHLASTVATSIGDLQWIAGFEYELQDDDRMRTEAEFGTGQPAPGAPPNINQDENVKHQGIFLQGTLDLSSGVVVLAGLRADIHDFTVDDLVPVTAADPDDSGSREMNGFSPSIGVSVPAGTVNFFGSIGTVFNTPTTTELGNQESAAGGFNPDLDPTRGESYELGVRGTLGSWAAFEVTGYQTNLRDELVAFEVLSAPGRTYFRNSGESRHRGAEATASAVSRNGLVRTDLTYSHTNAKFLEYEVDGEDLSGNRVPGVARDRVQLRIHVSPNRWWAEVVGAYVSVVQANDQNTALAPSYSVLDMRVGLDGVTAGGVRVSPWVALINTFNKNYNASLLVNAFGSRFFEPGPQRSLQIGMRAIFGSGN